MTKAAAAVKFAPESGEAPVPIVMRAINTLYLAGEAPPEAKLVVRDVSRGSPMTDAELKASIYAKGIIQPLIWKNFRGKDYVIAGNRRLHFLREIFADALASPVQTQNVDDFGGDWREVAIDTNLSLPPHLVERYELIVAIAQDMKLQPADVQARFGMTSRQYGQVMALGGMSPQIRQLWKDGEIDARTAQAFTLEPDPKEQDKIFAAVKKSAWQGRVDADSVQRKIIPQNSREAGSLVSFVGVEACRKAKILKQEDLFASNHIVTDTKVLNKLVGDRLAAKCDDLVKGGWAWAVPESKIVGNRYDYGTIEPTKKPEATPAEEARIAELSTMMRDDVERTVEDFEAIEDELELLQETVKERGFGPAQRAKSGCFLKIKNDGTLVIEYGRVKPSEKKSVAATERTAVKKAKSKPGEALLTNALATRLSEQLEKALSASLHASPHVAAAALIAGFASSGTIIDVNIGSSGYDSKGDSTFAQVFEGARKGTTQSQIVMLTKIAAEALSIAVGSATAKAPIDSPALQALVAALNPKVVNEAIAEAFDAKDYFAGVNAQASVDAVRCSMGDEHAAKVAKMKKAEAAKFAAANVPAKGWLPKELRTVHYAGPVEKSAAKKPAKTKAAKKAKAPKKKARK